MRVQLRRSEYYSYHSASNFSKNTSDPIKSSLQCSIHSIPITTKDNLFIVNDKSRYNILEGLHEA